MLLWMADNAFKLAREGAGLTQVEVAAALKVKQAAVSKWERGRALPGTRNLMQLAVLYGRGIDPLVKGASPEYDRLQRVLKGDETVSAHPVSAAQLATDTQAQLLLRRFEREQALVAATRQALGRKVGEIHKHLNDLTALVARLPRGQAPVARRGGPADAPHHRGRRGRDDRKRPPKPKTD